MFILITGLTACGTTTTTYEDNNKKLWNQFVVVEKQRSDIDNGLYIVYDTDTKVMYYMWYEGYKGGMSPIYNADGSIKVYDGD